MIAPKFIRASISLLLFLVLLLSATYASSAVPQITEADPQAVTMDEDSSPIAFSLTLNATDDDGDTLIWSILTAAAKGIAEVTTGTGNSQDIAYTPNPNYNGNDSFAVQVDDGLGGTDTITVIVTINPVNDPPVAVDDTATLSEGGTLNVAAPGVLSNDNDPDGDPLSVNTTPVSQPTNGTLTLYADGSYEYTYNGSATLSDSFVYEVSDGLGGTAQATVTLTLTDNDGDGIADIDDPDDDNDGMPDFWELANQFDPFSNDAAGDPDRDTLSNLEEYNNSTDPWMTDSDGDGIGDGTEVAESTDPLDPISAPTLTLTTSRLRVTDVTPLSFSVVWVANQAATCFVNVYADPDGNQLLKTLIVNDKIVDDSALHPPAADNGVMKVKVSGLSPNTTYYFRIVTQSNEGVLVEPAASTEPPLSVNTEESTTVINNTRIVHRILQSDGTTAAMGTLLLVEVEGGSHPITGWVGHNIAPPWAYVDLSNIYSESTHQNLLLSGGESITVESIGGFIGFRRFSAEVPTGTGTQSVVNPTPVDPDDYILDSAGPTIDTQQPDSGALINDNIPVISATYSDQSNIDLGSVSLLVDTVDVTAMAVVDSTHVEYTPASPLSEGSHEVTLLVADEWGYAADDPFSWTFTVDVTPPVVTTTFPNNGDYLYPASQVVRWSIEETNLASITVSLNGNGETLPPGATETPVELEPGLNTIEVAALDQAGNTGSSLTQVTLDEDTDGDGMPDGWEVANNLDPLVDDAQADADGDGYSNLEEYQRRTDPNDPNDPNSYPVKSMPWLLLLLGY